MAGTGRKPAAKSFAQVPSANIQRSKFNRSHTLKTAFDSGYLIPILVDEALPGDTFTCNLTTFGRLATPLRPIVDNLYLETFFFAVPYRLVFEKFQQLMGEDEGEQGSPTYLLPLLECPSGGYLENGLEDYMGIPTKVENLSPVCLWHRAYELIYQDWFRDQNMIDATAIKTDETPDDPTDYQLRKRGKRHDYLTSALPFAQKGPAVALPLQGDAPVIPDPLNTFPSFTTGGNSFFLRGTTSDQNTSWSGQPNTTGSAEWVNTGLVVDNSNVTGATINQLREASAIQRLYERDARGGTRYTEKIRSHFGVTSPDQRLQRPEYLGGGSQNITITPVAQTTQPIGISDPLATLGGYGVTSSSGSSFRKSFVEHTLVIGLACVRADLTYQQGLDKMFSRRDVLEFYWPELAHLGEQAVLNKEIYVSGTASDEDVFGYQERFAEYRFKQSKLTAEMRSNHSLSLDYWHLAQDFGSLPSLEQSFVEENPPVDRILAVPGERQLLLDCYFDYNCARPMPTYSVPGASSRF